MPSFYAKNELVQNRQLKVQRLSIPFSITGNATPASVVLANDEPAVLFLKSEGVNQITAALDGDTAPTFVSQNDANGLFSAMVKVGESVGKVMNAMIIRRTAHGLDTCKLADTDGITVLGDKIVLDCDTGVDLSAASLNACLVLEYSVAE